MKWTYNEKGHLISIEESQDENLLRVFCHTCDVTIDIFSQADYPKYRLAMNAAWAAKSKHVRSKPEQLSLDLT